MPKELIHFTIAERTAKQLANTRFAPCLEREPDGLLLGSIFHDALFYAVTPDAIPLESLAHRLHGADGEDTFALIRMQTAHAAALRDTHLPPALLVGMISHLFADVALHPLVWHLTGNYYDNDPASKSLARQHHRALESLMDMVVCPDMIGRARYRIGTMLRRCPELLTTGLPIAEVGTMASMEQDSARLHLSKAWRTFSILQSAFAMRPLARSLFALRPYLPNRAAEVATLFYAPQLMKQTDFLRTTITYAHPVSGETLSATLDELMDTAATMAATLCRRLESAVFDAKPLDLPETGPSMDAGLSNVPTRRMLHFARQPFPALT